MLNWLIYGMVYLGSALMVYNVYSYIQYARSLQETKDWGNARKVLNIPIFLLVFFLLGYLFVGILGRPDLVVAGILFGGSIFVFIIFKILRFITDRVQENEHLEAKVHAAEEISRSKTAFLSRVSHEMRTPMNAIIGLDTIALKNPDLPEETRVQLEKIGTSAGHLLGLIDNVLEMSTIESNSMELVKERFSLKKILNHLNELIRNECIEKGLEYQTTVIGNLNDFYIGDEKRVRQMLLNTLENAVKFTPAPGTVTFTTEQTDQNDEECTLRFIISDTGVGISEDFIPKLFSAFSQEDSSSTNRYGGSGLGMAITKNIVEKMNGRITVESEKDIRSTFTITVQLGRSDETEDAVSETEAESAERESCVLIAEDIDLNAEILTDLLDMEDIRCDRAEDGEIAVRMFSESPDHYYDAILMDLRMPNMDGLDAARNIRSLERADAGSVPIIALTANASDNDRRDVLDAGMDAHLSKPVDADKLYETLNRLISQRKRP